MNDLLQEMETQWREYQGGDFLPGEAAADVSWWLATIARELEASAGYQGHAFYAARWLRRLARVRGAPPASEPETLSAGDLAEMDDELTVCPDASEPSDVAGEER